MKRLQTGDVARKVHEGEVIKRRPTRGDDEENETPSIGNREISEEPQDEDEDEIENRRERLRQKMLEKAKEKYEEREELPVEEEQEESEESEYESEESEEEETPMLKPVFVPKSQRNTILEKERIEQEEELIKNRFQHWCFLFFTFL